MSRPAAIGAALLKSRPLPHPDPGVDKDGRGHALVIGGGAQTVGAALLAGIAALRAGAGKIRIATAASVAPSLAVRLPEARVFAVPDTEGGGLDPAAADRLKPLMAEATAAALGPGLVDPEATAALTAALVGAECRSLLIDAGCLNGLMRHREILSGRQGATVITPHAGEMAGCLGVDIAAVEADPVGTARAAAAELGAVVALKGRCTRIATPEGEVWESDHGNVGLATAGSGDVLAGLIVGLLARGAEPATAALWGVWMHGEAGVRLARTRGPLGYFAGELPGEFPAIMAALSEA
jgi:hydroxyethylthiazole kinase-like uncharacterized protein yjeF